jgi:hypothetical protein
VAQSAETLDALFVNLVMIFKTAAFQQMGKTLNPMTGKIEKNLEQARFSIDMIEMLKEKTRGNLSEDLGKFIDSTLLELRMNYVEEANAKAEPGEDAQSGEAAADAGGPAEDAVSGAEKAGSGAGTGDTAREPGSDSPDSDAGRPEDADSDRADPGDKDKGSKRG